MVVSGRASGIKFCSKLFPMAVRANVGTVQPEGRCGSLHRPSQSRGGRGGRTIDRDDSEQPDAGDWDGQHDQDSTSGPEDSFPVATWNIGSMSGRSGEVVEVMRERKVDICCLQETRWKGGGAR